MSSAYHVGKRLSFKGRLCTVRYIGQVEGTKSDKEYLGVEWDDLKGKHDGTHQGKRYFTCSSSSPTTASFVLSSSRTADQEQSFVDAVREKYGTPATADDSDEIIISGKTVEEVGFDKIRAQQARLHELKIVLVDGQRVSTAESSSLEIRTVCPKIEELDLSRNLFESLAEVARICTELESLKSLRINGNRFADISDASRLALEKPHASAFTKVADLSMDEILLDWASLIGLVAQFEQIKTLEASMNSFRKLNHPLKVDGLISLTLEYNKFQSMAEIMVLRELKSLEVLRLKGNEISRIDEETYEISKLLSFGKQLRYVDLSYNAISEWNFVNGLVHIFPGMTALRIANNPIYKIKKDVASFTSMDDSYMLTLARIGKLETLNFSKITLADRTNSEMFYLSQIAKEITAAPESIEQEIISRHPRYAELCEEHGAPTIIRKKAGALNPNSKEAQMIIFTLYLPADSQEGQTEEIRMVKEIPMSFDVWRVKDVVGKLFGLRPLSIRLMWETEEWDPVAGYDEWESEDEDGVEMDEEAIAAELKKLGRWVKREVEIEDSTRRIGNLVDGKEVTLRLEMRKR